MSLGDSSKHKKLRTPSKKALAFLSPLLIISAGLHGLTMLLPVPEREEIVEEEPELPESIQVSELPEIELPESEDSAPFVPTPEPEAPPIVPQPAPVIQQPVVQPAPVAQPSQPVEPQPVEPQPVTPDSREPDQNVKPDPVGKETVTPATPTGSTSVVRNYNPKNRTNNATYLSAFSSVLFDGTYSDGQVIEGYESLKNDKLTITLPAEDNCFAEAETVDADSVMLPISFGVVVTNDGDKGFVRYITIASDTGYNEANDLISQSLQDDITYEIVDNWLRTQVDGGTFPFKEADESIAYLIWTVEAIFTGHSCPDPAA